MTDTKKEQTASLIRSTALELFSLEGYHPATIRQIAKKAGIALGLMYSYYAGKEALLRELVQEGLGSVRNDFSRSAKGQAIPEQIDVAYRVLLRHREHWRLLHSVRMQKSLADYLAQEIEDINLFFIEHFRGELKKNKVKGARTESRLLWTCIDGIFAQKQIREDFDDDKTLKALALRYA